MDTTTIAPALPKVCRVGLGTWAIGGWLWGGTDEKTSMHTIQAALDAGINLIDTAPVYGFGLSEEIVGKALKGYGKRERLVVATKAGLQWQDSEVTRNASRERILKEVDDSLARLQLDWIDLYQIHWPDFQTPMEETASVMKELLDAGKIRAIGVSNFTPEMMETFRQVAPIHTLQPPFNLFEREIEEELLPYCQQHQIALVTYGVLCRGLLSGRMTPRTSFEGDDIRKQDPKFQPPRFERYLACVERLKEVAAERYHCSVGALAIRWAIDRGVNVALLGLRSPEQLAILDTVWGWHLSPEECQRIEALVDQMIPEPVGAEFMSPPQTSSGEKT